MQETVVILTQPNPTPPPPAHSTSRISIDDGMGRDVQVMRAPEGEVEARSVEEANVHEVYEAIAPHFSSTRYKVGRGVTQTFLTPHALTQHHDSLDMDALAADT